MIMKITSLLFWVQENKLSEKFYKKLGFDVTYSDESISIVTLNGFSIDLVNIRDEAKFAVDAMAQEKGRGMYVYVLVDDVDQKYSELVKQGFKPATEPKTWEWGNREFILKDPDGYKLCFYKVIK